MTSKRFEQALARYERASTYLESLIQGPPAPPPDATDEEIRQRAVARLERLRRFLEFIGNPHLRFRTFHVGGTSGKGSTSAFLASILTQAGNRTGLHVTPYLQVETEKLQIGDRLLPVDRFADHVDSLRELVQRWVDAGNPSLTYGEFWVALTFYAFEKEECDVAVIEVGAGGRFDLTNLVAPVVAVITSVGMDHVRTLGNTIPEIAWHKAGIIKPSVPAVTTVEDEAALDVIRQEASEKRAKLFELRSGRDFRTESGDSGQRLVIADVPRAIRLPLIGGFQAANAAAAVRAVIVARESGQLAVDHSTIVSGIERTRFPGRVEVVQDCPQVVLDGAHNPEKMTALMVALQTLAWHERRILVLGSLGGHDYLSVARIAAQFATEVIITAPSAIERTSAPVDEILDTIRSIDKSAEIIAEPQLAVREALRLAGPVDQIVVTGSLYLVGAARELWYPARAILKQQTSWPRLEDECGN